MFRKLGELVRSKKATFITGLIVAFAVVAGVGTLGGGKVSAIDCGYPNDIMGGGFSSTTDFTNKANVNVDLQLIYHEYGLTTADYPDFIANARPGTAYKNGTVVVDGLVVMTGTNSIGRLAGCQGSGYFSQVINGHTYYGNTNDKAFATDGLPVMVLFGNDGVAKFAALTDCGNPMGGTRVQPSFSCDELNVTPVSGKDRTYKFTTNATQGVNATIDYVIYDFGNGKTKKVTGGGNFETEYQYPVAGEFEASVTVYVKLPGGKTGSTVPASKCKKKIVIATVECKQLTGIIADKTRTTIKVQFTATAGTTGGATLKTGDFDFGDGNKVTAVMTKDGQTVVVEHTYTFPEETKDKISYSAEAVLHFTVDGKDVTAAGCPAVVKYDVPPQPECKPGIPEGDVRCTPCKYDSSLPQDSPKCVPPELPNTGAGNVIAIFAAVVIGGFLVYRQLLFRKHKAAFLDAQNGTSPLPLGDPLSDRPLDGTPLERAKRSFRRGRRF